MGSDSLGRSQLFSSAYRRSNIYIRFCLKLDTQHQKAQNIFIDMFPQFIFSLNSLFTFLTSNGSLTAPLMYPSSAVVYPSNTKKSFSNLFQVCKSLSIIICFEYYISALSPQYVIFGWNRADNSYC